MIVMEVTNWTEQQLAYIEFLTDRPKSPKDGKREEAMSKEEFAESIGVTPMTLYRWQALPGFKTTVFESSLASLSSQIPNLNKAMIGKSMGIKEFKNADVAAYTVLMRQFALLKADKSEVKNETEHSGTITVEGLDDEQLNARLKQIITGS